MAGRTDHERLTRILKIARTDGWMLIAIAGPSAVLAALLGDFAVAIPAVGVCACGAFELSGQRALARGVAAGLPRLWTAQLLTLGLILAYAWHRWSSPPEMRILALLSDFSRAQLAELFPDPHEIPRLLKHLQQALAAAIAGVAVLFQGGLAFYYFRARTALRRALTAPPPFPPAEKSG